MAKRLCLRFRQGKVSDRFGRYSQMGRANHARQQLPNRACRRLISVTRFGYFFAVRQVPRSNRFLLSALMTRSASEAKYLFELSSATLISPYTVWRDAAFGR